LKSKNIDDHSKTKRKQMEPILQQRKFTKRRVNRNRRAMGQSKGSKPEDKGKRKTNNKQQNKQTNKRKKDKGKRTNKQTNKKYREREKSTYPARV